MLLASYKMVASLEKSSMQYQVLVRKPAETHFIASVVGLSDVVADGQTEEEAIGNVKVVLASQLESAKLVTIEVESSHHFGLDAALQHGQTNEADHAFETEESSPWKKRAGAFADDPTWDDFLEEIAVYREQVDRATNL